MILYQIFGHINAGYVFYFYKWYNAFLPYFFFILIFEATFFEVARFFLSRQKAKLFKSSTQIRFNVKFSE